MESRGVLYNLRILKIIGIILVVIGHSMALFTGEWVFKTNEYSIIIKNISAYISLFHMPLFFFVSGCIYMYCISEKGQFKTLEELVRKKFNRLIIPYLLVGIIYTIPIWMILGLKTESFLNNSILLLVGYSGSYLWYLMTLFNVFIIFGVFREILRGKNQLLIIAILFLLNIFSDYLPSIFLINKTAFYMIYFYLGYYFFKNKDNMNEILIKNTNKITIFTILILLGIVYYKNYILGNEVNYSFKVIQLVGGIAGVLQCYTLSSKISRKNIHSNFIKIIDKYSFEIYLFHEPIIFIIIHLGLYKLLKVKIIPIIIAFLISVIGSVVIAKIVKFIGNRFRSINND